MSLLKNLIREGVVAATAKSATPATDVTLDRSKPVLVADVADVAVANDTERGGGGRSSFEASPRVADVAGVAVADANECDGLEARALTVLRDLVARQSINLTSAGYSPSKVRVRIADWRVTTGETEFDFWQRLRALESAGLIEREWGYVRMRAHS